MEFPHNYVVSNEYLAENIFLPNPHSKKKKKNNILKIAKQKTKPHLIKYLLKYIKNKEIDING